MPKQLAQDCCHPHLGVQVVEEGSPEPCSGWAGQEKLLSTPMDRAQEASEDLDPIPVLSLVSPQDPGWGQAMEPG